MTKEEYIAKQRSILESAIEDTFKEKPYEIELAPVMCYRYVRTNKVEFDNTRKECYCLKCRNKTFYISHLKPRTLICSECFTERYIDGSHTIITKRTIQLYIISV